MPSYDDIFGGSGKSWLTIRNEDEKVAAIFLDYEKVPQKTDDGKAKWMVQVEEGGKWGPKAHGTFDPEDVAGAFPLFNVELKLEVDGKEMYHTLSGSSEEAFKAALKKAGGIEPGDTLGIWLVSTASKPYTWKHVIEKQES